MVYETLLLIGIVGLAAQTVLGFAHGHGNHGEHGGHGGHGSHGAHDSHAGHHAGHGAATHAPGHSASHGHGHGHAAHGHDGHNHAGHHEQGAKSGGSALLSLLSPLTLFSLCFGAGLTGMAVRGTLPPTLTAMAAAGGAAAFYGLIVRPIWNLIFSFASKPAETLESMVAREAEATCHFDAQGRGMVRAVVDGEVVRLLAHLESDDRTKGVVVTPGEKVVVTSVDTQKNTVRVTRL
jgi:hypothetical protein